MCVCVCAQALASAIASTQVMKAQQVVKGENGDEVSVRLASVCRHRVTASHLNTVVVSSC